MAEERALGTTLVTGALLAGVLVLAVGLRLVEPLSSPALGAEDPYTHVVFTKEALERGWFGDSTYLGTGMYPPGFHAIAGALAPLGGERLYDFARFSPVVFGALAVLGTFVLVRRLSGPTAGLVAAFLTAVMPEHVFRTNIFFPTGLDLALLPAFLLAFHEAVVAHGRLHRGAAALFLLIAACLTVSHPWVVPLFVAPALAYALLRGLRAPTAPRPLLAAALLASLAAAFAMASRWKDSDTGFADFFALIPGLRVLSVLTLPVPILFVALFAILAGAGALAAYAVSFASRHPLPRLARVGIAAVVALVLIAIALRLGRASLPLGVDYAHQLGLVAIVLALVGIAVACLAPSAAGDLALPLALVLFPLTAINVFHSPFWPQRSVAYLCVPIALLGALPLAWAVNAPLARVRSPSARRVLGPAAIAAALLLTAGAVAAHPAPTYSWYRLYSDEQFAGFQRTADAMSTQPTAQAIVWDWQPALMVKTLASPAQARYAPTYFTSAGERDKIHHEQHQALYVVVDSYLQKAVAKHKADVSFLDSGGYRLVYRTADGSFRLYEVVR